MKLSVDEVKKTVNRVLRGVLRFNTVEVMDVPLNSVAGTTEIPKGETTPDGRVIVYAASADSEIDVFRTVFHELFHRDLALPFSVGRVIVNDWQRAWMSQNQRNDGFVHGR